MIPGNAGDETRLRRGVALLAREARCAVIPVRIVGASSLLPAGVHWPRRAAVRITFFPPFFFADAENAAQLTVHLRAAFFAS
jgi:1-acyl-sn-glycerol-3-phosphate acyltransferase